MMMSMTYLLRLLIVAIYCILSIHAKLSPSDYKEEADQIFQALGENGPLAGQAWDRLAKFTDTIGNRVSGSQNLRDAVKYMLNALTEDGLDNVHGEEAMVPHWVRGKEECTMLSPRRDYRMNILGLGSSIGTPKEGLIGEVVVVEDFDALDRLGQAGGVTGKIVLLNYYCDWSKDPVDCYGETAKYRGGGASRASSHGAVAYLVKSLASFSIASPHTGMQSYLPGSKPIPAVAVTVEDAEAISRMQERRQKIVLKLYMEGRNLPDEISHNVIAEFKGRERPEEVVLLSGHLDSWDVGVGAMDDGGGVAIAWQALSTLRQLGLRPKRTIRLVLWTCEEFGGIGARQYYQDHKNESDQMVLVMESDIGAFKPKGLFFAGSDAAGKIMSEVGQLLLPINASTIIPGGNGYETDTGPWQLSGVPGASLASHNEKYFYYHHSQGDQMQVLDKRDLGLAAAMFAVTAYVIADLDDFLPR